LGPGDFLDRRLKGYVRPLGHPDEKGIIREAYYGKDEGDHMAIDRVEAFVVKGD